MRPGVAAPHVTQGLGLLHVGAALVLPLGPSAGLGGPCAEERRCPRRFCWPCLSEGDSFQFQRLGRPTCLFILTTESIFSWVLN